MKNLCKKLPRQLGPFTWPVILGFSAGVVFSIASLFVFHQFYPPHTEILRQLTQINSEIHTPGSREYLRTGNMNFPAEEPVWLCSREFGLDPETTEFSECLGIRYRLNEKIRLERLLQSRAQANSLNMTTCSGDALQIPARTVHG